MHPSCARLGHGREEKNPVFKCHSLWIGKATDDMKCVTYWNTVESPLVTQTEATMKVSGSVFILEQEEQGRETSLQ